MNENAKKWVAALRSGKYEQGRGALCKNGKYCCLFVGVMVFVAHGGTVALQPTKDGTVAVDGSEFVIPDCVRKWLGLATCNGKFSRKNGITSTGSLSRANDVFQFSFSQIADIIESQPPGLFKE